MPKPLQSPNLTELPGIRHGFFTREGGTSDGIYHSLNCGFGSSDDPGRVRQNRARVAHHLGSSDPAVLTVHQTHSAQAVVADRLIVDGELPKADAIATRTPGLAIGILTADCAPVLFADAEAQVVACAHAGWRGAVAGILEATVNAMTQLGADASRIFAAVGPCISQPNYEVGPEFQAELLSLDPDNDKYFAQSSPNARPHFDLPAYVLARLARLELGSTSALGPCTFAAESQFFSYRRSKATNEPDYGRQISAIVVT